MFVLVSATYIFLQDSNSVIYNPVICWLLQRRYYLCFPSAKDDFLWPISIKYLYTYRVLEPSTIYTTKPHEILLLEFQPAYSSHSAISGCILMNFMSWSFLLTLPKRNVHNCAIVITLIYAIKLKIFVAHTTVIKLSQFN